MFVPSESGRPSVLMGTAVVVALLLPLASIVETGMPESTTKETLMHTRARRRMFLQSRRCMAVHIHGSGIGCK
jgi:hypothetical protein